MAKATDEKKVVTLEALAVVVEKIKTDYITVEAATQKIAEIVEEQIDETIDYATEEEVRALFDDTSANNGGDAGGDPAGE